MMKKTFNAVALALFLAGAFVAGVPVNVYAASCTSADGTASCSCTDGPCWAGPSSCGCMEPPKT